MSTKTTEKVLYFLTHPRPSFCFNLASLTKVTMKGQCKERDGAKNMARSRRLNYSLIFSCDRVISDHLLLRPFS